MSTSKEELHAMLEEEELKDASLLVFANKQDMEGAMSSAEVSDALGLSSLKMRQWSIYRTSALKGEGLTEGLDWYVKSTILVWYKDLINTVFMKQVGEHHSREQVRRLGVITMGYTSIWVLLVYITVFNHRRILYKNFRLLSSFFICTLHQSCIFQIILFLNRSVGFFYW